MKNSNQLISILAMPALILFNASCSLQGNVNEASITVRFTEETAIAHKGWSAPDVNSFILKISSNDGYVIYEGKYGSSPEVIKVKEGTYCVSAISEEFKEPLFERPQYGDSKVVSVKSGGNADVILSCRQTNSGIRLFPDNSFISEFPKGSITLSGADGELLYDYSEKRTAFFSPGTVKAELNVSGNTQLLFSRTLSAQQILSIGLSAVKGVGQGEGVEISVDTSRIWNSEELTVGEKGKTKDTAISVSEARTAGETNDIWVFGYIVGGDLTSGKCSFSAPFSSNTNIVLAARSNVTDKSLCISVQLPKGDLRDDLNLVDNPDNLGKTVFLRGNLVESYYGIPGIRDISEYELD